MRPRVFPAEDTEDRLAVTRGNGASMRPRVFPAEDEKERRLVILRITHASMRPRVFPAEDGVTPRRIEEVADSFNEAAGIPRGRREGTSSREP